MKKIYFYPIYRCENNSYFGNQICTFLETNGYTLVNKLVKADAIIFNTCAVTQNVEDDCLSVINFYRKKYSGRKQIIVYGCLPKINERFSKIPDVVCIGPYDIDKFNYIFSHEIPIQKIRNNIINRRFLTNFNKELCEYTIMISQGCVSNCSYCVIKKAKGIVNSKSVHKIIVEVREGVLKGYRHIRLIADDCGCYGVDIKTNFGNLIKQICILQEKFSLFIHYLEPGEFIKYFDEIKQAVIRGRIYHINIPIQTGSQRILKLMNRHYNIFEVIKKVRELKRYPYIHLATDIMMGFSTETTAELNKSLEYSLAFDTVELFLYSPRKGTPASLMKPISKEKMDFRHRLGLKLENKYPTKFNYSRRG